MKKITGLLITVIVVAIGILNLILFLSVKNTVRLSEAGFWLSWVFSTPVALLLGIISIIFPNHIKKYEGITIPASVITTFVGLGIIEIVNIVFFVFTRLAWEIPLITNIILVAIYILVIVLVCFASGHISKNDRVQKEKVFYIRDLANDVQMLVSLVTEQALKNDLNKLYDDIKYSDPMSHASLSSVEEELKQLIFKISTEIEEDNLEEAAKTVKEASFKLKYRNNKCKNLK